MKCQPIGEQWAGQDLPFSAIKNYTIGWLEKQKFPKNNFRHADPGVCHTKKDNYLSYISFESNG